MRVGLQSSSISTPISQPNDIDREYPLTVPWPAYRTIGECGSSWKVSGQQIFSETDPDKLESVDRQIP
jgi:hypothetical protein